jgi:dinuclear metal center YbgI/SA1388 family protein
MISRNRILTPADASMSQYCVDDVVDFLDSYLRTQEIVDDARALNGTQVTNSGRLLRLAAAVDACQATIDAAVATGAGLLIVHHGLFWRGLEPLTGRHGRRVLALVRGDVALYAAHLPLDCHPEVGNNPVLARGIGLRDLQPFGDVQGVKIGVVGDIQASRANLAGAVQRLLGAVPRVLATGPEQVHRVAVVTGAGSQHLREALEAGADTLITGEGPHHSYFDAEEWGVNVILGGHYATETLGVKALAEVTAQRFNVPWEFLDHPTGL